MIVHIQLDVLNTEVLADVGIVLWACSILLTDNHFDMMDPKAVVFCVQIRVDIQLVVLNIEDVIKVDTGLWVYLSCMLIIIFMCVITKLQILVLGCVWILNCMLRLRIMLEFQWT